MQLTYLFEVISCNALDSTNQCILCCELLNIFVSMEYVVFIKVTNLYI